MKRKAIAGQPLQDSHVWTAMTGQPWQDSYDKKNMIGLPRRAISIKLQQIMFEVLIFQCLPCLEFATLRHMVGSGCPPNWKKSGPDTQHWGEVHMAQSTEGCWIIGCVQSYEKKTLRNGWHRRVRLGGVGNSTASDSAAWATPALWVRRHCMQSQMPSVTRRQIQPF
jgi:hypothetical protein